MKFQCVALTGTLFITLNCAFAGDSDDKTEVTKKKLVGVWVAQEGGKTPAGSTFELTKEGRFKSSLKIAGSEIKHKGVYKLEGDTLTASYNRADGSEKIRILKILKLTDSDLIVSDEDEKSTLKKKTQ